MRRFDLPIDGGRRKALSLACGVLLAAGLISCSADPDLGGDSAGTIVIKNFDFGDSISVEQGAQVTVTNADGVGHTWTAEDAAFDSGFLLPDTSFELTFIESGEFGFFCSIHPSMTGSITVSP